MRRKALAALLPIGCAFILLGVLNHVKLHLNVDHFAIIMAVLAVICIAIGGWASIQELRGAPDGSAAPVPAPVAYGAAPTNVNAPAPTPVTTGPDDPTIQS